MPTDPVLAANAAADLARTAAAAIGRIDAWGRRGCTRLSVEEIEAMAVLLALLGLPVRHPGTPEGHPEIERRIAAFVAALPSAVKP